MMRAGGITASPAKGPGEADSAQLVEEVGLASVQRLSPEQSRPNHSPILSGSSGFCMVVSPNFHVPSDSREDRVANPPLTLSSWPIGESPLLR